MLSRRSLLRGPALPTVNQEPEEPRHWENHLSGKSSYLKTMVFGGLDGTAGRLTHSGVLSMFAVVSGAAGAAVPLKKLLCLSFGSLFASAFSMAYGEYVSSKAEQDFVTAEKAREELLVAR